MPPAPPAPAGTLRIVPVENPGDERVADYVGLTDAQLRRGHSVNGTGRSGGPGVFIAEGRLAVARLVRSPYRVRSVLLTPRRLGDVAGDLGGLDAPVYVAAPEVMNAVAGFDVHRGVLAAADRRSLPDPHTLLEGARLVVVLEGINDHENMGGLFRNAAAFGAGAVLLSPRCCDPLYRRSVRVSLGHVLGVPFTTLEPWPDALVLLGGAGFPVVALTPDRSAQPIHTVDVAPDARLALAIGAEGPGLSAPVLAGADRRVRIPMAAGVDSLNVVSAAAVALHHFALRATGEGPG